MFVASSLFDLKLLLVEDDEDDYIITRDLLDELVAGQYELDWARTAKEAREQFARGAHHLCLIDYHLGPDDGLRLLEEAPRIGFHAPIIMLTGQDDVELDLGALRAGAVDYLVKSQLTSQSLARAIRYAVARSEMESERSERHRAEAENQAKSEFLAHLSHELRTPLSAILGYTDLLLSNDPDAEARSHLQIVKRNGNHLLGLLNDVLDLSKIEAGRLEIESQEVKLGEFFADLRSLMASSAMDKGVALSFRADGDLPRSIWTDALRFRQILINLISNAIKFTDEGSVEVVVANDPGRNSHLRVAVKDTGIGIGSQDQRRLFTPFVQVGRAASAHKEGTGLGLAISRQLAKRLGGDIVMESRLGQGSVFTVTIEAGAEGPTVLEPLSLERASESSEGVRRTLLSGRVLVADDLTDIRNLVGYMIRRAGVSVVEASDGKEAVEKALAARELGEPFDVLILDVQMPGLDGLTATRRLRKAGITTPILALTAATMSGERERCLAAGCTDHLSKPIDESRLLGTLRRYLPCGEAPAAETALAPDSTVLLVEDDPDARDATSKILGLLGWRVLEAGSGVDALRAVSEAAAPPVLALVDLSLPDMDGYELIRQLRGRGCQRTRCVSLSGREEDPVRAKEVGVDQHLLKPVGIGELRAFAREYDRATPDSAD